MNKLYNLALIVILAISGCADGYGFNDAHGNRLHRGDIVKHRQTNIEGIVTDVYSGGSRVSWNYTTEVIASYTDNILIEKVGKPEKE